MNSLRTTALFILILVLLLGLAACGKSATTAPPVTDTKMPQPTAQKDTASAVQDTATPVVTASPTAVSTNTPEPTLLPPTETPVVPPAAEFQPSLCPFDLPLGQSAGKTVECGYLVVPENRTDPGSATIRLAVAIFRNPASNPEPDPIFYLEGGPGGSPLELISLTFERIFEPMMAANRDLVIFDQRGVGFSRPALDCPQLNRLGMELLDNEKDGQELTQEEMTALNLQAVQECAQNLGAKHDLNAYNTAENAADVNDLRLALGYQKINLWGISYGTNLALEVMRRYPQGIRSVVLDSIYPPDVDLLSSGPENADRAFDIFFTACAEDAECNTAYPDLRTMFFDTVAKLNETPARFKVSVGLERPIAYDVILNGDNLIGVLFQLLYDTESIPVLPKLIKDASQGNYDLVALVLGSLLSVREVVSDGMQITVLCHDEIPFNSPETLEAGLEAYPELAPLYKDSFIGMLGFEICSGWGAGQADPAVNTPVTSDLPVLIMTGEYDPITPPAWGQQVAESLSNSLIFQFPGMGHGVTAVQGCPQEMTIAFWNDPSQAPDDGCIVSLDAPTFIVPTEQAKVELAPFTNADFGIQGLIPVGWQEVTPGTYSRGTSSLDVALLLVQVAPLSVDQLLGVLVQQLTLGETPEPVGERQANGLEWKLYQLEVQGLQIDLALAQANDLAILVLLQSAADERQALYDSVLLPVIDSVKPID
jgi:pimeloyl-ACP methyl ester carboxylesterase